MAYATWPTALLNPDRPVQVTNTLPLVTGDPDKIGAFITERNETRPTVNATASLLLEAGEFQTFLSFWRDTIFNGRKIFEAPWIEIAGYPDYVARLINFTMGSNGVLPQVSLQLEFLPDIRLDVTNTFPDVWPPLT